MFCIVHFKNIGTVTFYWGKPLVLQYSALMLILVVTGQGGFRTPVFFSRQEWNRGAVSFPNNALNAFSMGAVRVNGWVSDIGRAKRQSEINREGDWRQESEREREREIDVQAKVAKSTLYLLPSSQRRIFILKSLWRAAHSLEKKWPKAQWRTAVGRSSCPE